jgi:hypothetical protein
VASSLDEHLGRDIRHDDVYEELVPTTHCKTNKKTHSLSPPLKIKQGVGDVAFPHQVIMVIKLRVDPRPLGCSHFLVTDIYI